MSGRVLSNLERLGISLPVAAAPAANYVPFVCSGTCVHISGQLPKGVDGKMVIGQLGAPLTVAEGQEAARLCAINLMSQIQAATGNMDRVKRIVKLNVFVNSAPTFIEQPQVANGASDLFVSAFGGDVGRHARAAVGVAQLPFGVAVEADAIVEVEEPEKK